MISMCPRTRSRQAGRLRQLEIRLCLAQSRKVVEDHIRQAVIQGIYIDRNFSGLSVNTQLAGNVFAIGKIIRHFGIVPVRGEINTRDPFTLQNGVSGRYRITLHPLPSAQLRENVHHIRRDFSQIKVHVQALRQLSRRNHISLTPRTRQCPEIMRIARPDRVRVRPLGGQQPIINPCAQ